MAPTDTSAINWCSVGTLNTDSGYFELSTTDKTAHPPGSYTIEILAFAKGIDSANIYYDCMKKLQTYTLTLVDRCSAALGLTITIANPPTQPSEWYYNGNTYTLSTSGVFVSNYPECPITYSCAKSFGATSCELDAARA